MVRLYVLSINTDSNPVDRSSAYHIWVYAEILRLHFCGRVVGRSVGCFDIILQGKITAIMKKFAIL